MPTHTGDSRGRHPGIVNIQCFQSVVVFPDHLTAPPTDTIPQGVLQPWRGKMVGKRKCERL